MFWFIAIVAGIILIAREHINKTAQLKSAYDRALKGTDKAAALQAGRAYYAALRGPGKTLTIYDEQAIANDISTMKN